ncbi:MAG: hypothetical protein WKF57_09240 [Nakamurella sp.]
MSELRTEARLLLQTVEDRLLEWRSLIPATDPAAPATDPAAPATDPAAQGTGPTARVTDPAGSAGSAGDHPAAAHAEHQGTAGCPLCTVLAVVRGERPELAAALLDGAVTALQLVRTLVSESEQSEQSAQPDPEGAAADPPTPLAPAPEPALPAAAQRPPPERIRIS